MKNCENEKEKAYYIMELGKLMDNDEKDWEGEQEDIDFPDCIYEMFNHLSERDKYYDNNNLMEMYEEIEEEYNSYKYNSICKFSKKYWRLLTD